MTLSALNGFFLLLFKNCIVYLIFCFLTSERLMRILCYIILTLQIKKINELTYFLSCILCFIECCTVSVHYAICLIYFATMYFYHYVYCIFIRICFIALCNICSLMSENSSVEVMFIFITRR